MRPTPELLRRLREESLMSMEDVARQTGVAISTVCHLERGKHRPQPRTLRKLLTCYEIQRKRFADARADGVAAVIGSDSGSHSAPSPLQPRTTPRSLAANGLTHP